jgi:hypothetical protein
MRVFLTTAYTQRVALGFLLEASRLDRFKVHRVVDSPDEADAIIFVENAEHQDPVYKRLLRHPLIEKYPSRVFMYNEYDFPYCTLPGLYASMPKRSFNPRKQVAFSYLFKPNEYVSSIFESGMKPDLLYSFTGAPNHKFRRRVLSLSDPRAHIEDTRAYSIWQKSDPAEDLRRRRSYADVMARSKFVLCPRGAGTSSFRFFETLEAGRVPVVISDQWVAPHGPDWKFLLRVKEAELGSIPDVLRAAETESYDRGQEARKCWERWFAPQVVFHHAVEEIEKLSARIPVPSLLDQRLLDPEYIRVRCYRAVLSRWDARQEIMQRALKRLQFR